MSEQTTSHTQQAQDAWKKMIEDHLTRVEQFQAEVARVEAQTAERAREAIDEMARMSKETLSYAGQVSAEWRRLTLEATKNAFAWTGIKG